VRYFCDLNFILISKMIHIIFFLWALIDWFAGRMQQQLSATAGCIAVQGADSIGFRRCIFHRSSRYSCNSASEQHAIVDSSVTLLLPVCFTSRLVKYYYAINKKLQNDSLLNWTYILFQLLNKIISAENIWVCKKHDYKAQFALFWKFSITKNWVMVPFCRG
jgi:hypothetical protein